MLRKRIMDFFRPSPVTIIIFLVLALLVPVGYVYAEPERTNYLPGEHQLWDIKAKLYNGLLDEVFNHTEGSLDDLLGILHRDYLSNYIGVPLLVIYYSIASTIKKIIFKILTKNLARNII